MTELEIAKVKLEQELPLKFEISRNHKLICQSYNLIISNSSFWSINDSKGGGSIGHYSVETIIPVIKKALKFYQQLSKDFEKFLPILSPYNISWCASGIISFYIAIDYCRCSLVFDRKLLVGKGHLLVYKGKKLKDLFWEARDPASLLRDVLFKKEEYN